MPMDFAAELSLKFAKKSDKSSKPAEPKVEPKIETVQKPATPKQEEKRRTVVLPKNTGLFSESSEEDQEDDLFSSKPINKKETNKNLFDDEDDEEKEETAPIQKPIPVKEPTPDLFDEEEIKPKKVMPPQPNAITSQLNDIFAKKNKPKSDDSDDQLFQPIKKVDLVEKEKNASAFIDAPRKTSNPPQVAIKPSPKTNLFDSSEEEDDFSSFTKPLKTKVPTPVKQSPAPVKKSAVLEDDDDDEFDLFDKPPQVKPVIVAQTKKASLFSDEDEEEEVKPKPVVKKTPTPKASPMPQKKPNLFSSDESDELFKSADIKNKVMPEVKKVVPNKSLFDTDSDKESTSPELFSIKKPEPVFKPVEKKSEPIEKKPEPTIKLPEKKPVTSLFDSEDSKSDENDLFSNKKPPLIQKPTEIVVPKIPQPEIPKPIEKVTSKNQKKNLFDSDEDADDMFKPVVKKETENLTSKKEIGIKFKKNI